MLEIYDFIMEVLVEPIASLKKLKWKLLIFLILIICGITLFAVTGSIFAWLFIILPIIYLAVSHFFPDRAETLQFRVISSVIMFGLFATFIALMI